MPSLALLAPVVLPVLAGGVSAALGLAGLKPGRAIVGAGAWGAVIALFVLWLPVRSSQELNLGPLGFGALKLALHRACVSRLFEQNDLLLDAEEIYAIAKTMVG